MRTPQHRTACGLAAAAVLTVTPIVPSSAADSPFIGNWSGVWDNGQHNEFRVVSIDDDGRATALYCAERGEGGFYFDVTPDGIETTLKRSGKVLEFRRPKSKMRYRFTLTGDDTLTFRYTRNGKHNTLEMTKRDPSGCAARIEPPTPE